MIQRAIGAADQDKTQVIIKALRIDERPWDLVAASNVGSRRRVDQLLSRESHKYLQ